MTIAQLKIVLDNHQHWLNEDVDGWENMRADLSGAYLIEADLSRAYLTGADLREADLREADLSGAYLRGANLRRANLSGADLREANLRGADLREANLRGADLTGANLRRADLRGANLSGADLRGAYLIEADLSGAYLRGANLRGANLIEADLRGANLSGADLSGALNIPFIPFACPDNGSFTAYKKANGYIVELEIPKEAKRCSATGRICRCNMAKVISIQNNDGSESGIDVVKSDYDSSFVYKVGEIVKVENFDDDRWNERSTGIHFFINRQEAVIY